MAMLNIPAVRLALPAGAALAAAAQLLIPMPALGQGSGSADSESQVIEEVVVTGTRIRGVAPVGSDLTVLDSEDMLRFPAPNPVEALNRQPEFSGIGNNAAVKRASGPGTRSTNGTRGSDINLRGIGPRATLTLFDGARRPPTGQTGRNVDAANLPVIALDRVEIIADGGSAIYGSDAVAGVVNFVPKKTFEGLKVQARHAMADAYDNTYLGVVGGSEWADGGFVVSVEHNTQSNLSGSDRSYFRSDLRDEGGNDYRSTNCAPGNITVDGQTYAIPEGGVTPATADQLIAGTANRCEIIRQADILPEQDITNVYGAFEQRVGERVKVYGRVLWSEREWLIRETDQGSQTNHDQVSVPESNAFFVRPPGTTGPVDVSYNFGSDHGPLVVDGATEYTSIGAGLEYEFTPEWTGTLEYDYAEIDDGSVVLGMYGPAEDEMLASSDPDVAYNVFGAGGENAGAKADNLFRRYFDPFGAYEMQEVSATVDGGLFEIPGGRVRIALGAEWYEIKSELGNTIGDARTVDQREPSIVALERDVTAYFAEVFLPLVSEANAVPGIQSLEVSAAIRRDDYSDFGTTDNPKVGVNWSPTRSLTLRGSYGTSFIAPDLASNQPPSIGASITYATRVDPSAPNGTSEGAIWTDANPDLQPEEADTYSIGADYRPESLPGLLLKGTHFWIDYDGQVGNVNSQTALQDPNAAPYVTRGPTAAQLDAIEATGIRVSGSRPADPAFLIDARTQNLGGVRLRGFDLHAGYDWETDDAGYWEAEVGATYLYRYDVAVLAGDPYDDNLNTIYNPIEFRGRGRLGWNRGPWFAEGFLNYTGGYDNNFVTPGQSVDSYTTVDLRVGMDVREVFQAVNFAEDMTVSLEVLNVLDEDPPFVNIDGGADFTVASPFGRYVSLTLGMTL